MSRLFTHSVKSVSVLLLLILPALSQSQTFSLFNGHSLEGWHVDVPELDQHPDAPVPFIVREGAEGPLLVSLGTPGGHLITDEVFADYRLEVEYRFAGKPGNCGVLVHASTPRALYGMFPKSLEVQMQHEHAGDFWCIVEDITVPDMEKRRGPKDKWGIVEGKNRRIENLTDHSEKPAGEWNKMVIECLADSLTVWVNDELVNAGYHCTASQGQIGIQAEGSEVEFRKIDLTRLVQTSWENEVTVETRQGKLAGTLLYPNPQKPCQVALIIAGSGPTDRNGNNAMMKNNSLKYLAEDLAREGIASLRYDKRGIGASVGAAISEADLRFDDFVEDARSWIRWLNADERFSEIIVIGHSEGSLIGMLASEMEEVDRYVSLAGAGQPIDKVLRKQLSPQGESIYQESCRIMDSLLLGETVREIPGYLNSLFRPSIQPYLISWFKLNPAEIIQGLDKPVLLVQGTTDIQVDMEEVELLSKARPDAPLIKLDSMNHVFKIAPSQRLLNISTYNLPQMPNHPLLSKYICAFIKGKQINVASHILWPVTDSKDTHDGYPYWSPDGSELLYSSGTRTTCNTIRLNLSTGEKDFLLPTFAQHAQWSPDGNRIVFDGNFGRQIEWVLVGQKQTTVLKTGKLIIENSGMPCWSPDGEKVAFTSGGGIYIQHILDSIPELLFQKEGWICIPFDWCSETEILADLRKEADVTEADIWEIAVEHGESRPIITLPGRQVKPDVSPDGKRILFASDHGGNADLWISDRKGGQLQRLTWYEGDLLNPGYDLEASWSPDGKRIAFSSTRSGNWGIWIMEPKL